MMKPRPWLTACVTLGVLGMGSVACANGLSPYVWFWPGIVTINLPYAFPASLLAAFVERPFLTAAGIRRRALVVSLRANLLSTIIGMLCLPVGLPALYTIGPLWCVIAFGISCVTEIFYARRFCHGFRWGWAIGGNAVSSLILMVLPPVAFVLKQSHPKLAWSLEPYEMWMLVPATALSVAAFLLSFAWRVPRDGRDQRV